LTGSFGDRRLEGYSDDAVPGWAFYTPSFVVSPRLRADDGYCRTL
jgi:hypothetical protein